jgi:hypothetical protein
MGGKSSPVRVGGGGRALPMDIAGDLQNPGNIGNNLFGRSTEGVGGVGKVPTTGLEIAMAADAPRRAALASQQASQAALDAKAAAMGFTNEADRIAKVTNIINSFGKARTNKALPAILNNLGGKSGIAGHPGIMTKGK